MLRESRIAISSLAGFIDPGVAAPAPGRGLGERSRDPGRRARELARQHQQLPRDRGRPANAGLFTTRSGNVRGEMAGRGQAARYMIAKLLPPPEPSRSSQCRPRQPARPGSRRAPTATSGSRRPQANKIGRITTAGVITGVRDSDRQQPAGSDIAWGPTATSGSRSTPGNKIGRITPAGVITDSRFRPPAAARFGITAGPDGNLWFTGVSRQQDRPDHAGRSDHRVPGPTAAAQPADHAGPRREPLVHRDRRQQDRPDHARRRDHRVRDPDGQRPADGNRIRAPTGTSGSPKFSGDKIGRITPAGVITEFPHPDGGQHALMGSPPAPTATSGSPSTSATGSGGSRPRARSPSSRFRPRAASPTDIATGPDGNLWFTENGGNKIGRISP